MHSSAIGCGRHGSLWWFGARLDGSASAPGITDGVQPSALESDFEEGARGRNDR